jgi:hypothetical protein
VAPDGQDGVSIRDACIKPMAAAESMHAEPRRAHREASRPFLAWAKSLDDSGAVPNPAGEQTVYLIPGFGTEQESKDLLRLVHAEVFAQKLHGWHTIEADWPTDRSFAAFQKWLHVELHSVVEDICAAPLMDDDE